MIDATVARLTLRIASFVEVREVLAEITHALVADLGAALARVWLVDPSDPSVLRLVASAGLSERRDGSRARVRIGDLKIGQIAETRQSLVTTELATDPRFVDKGWVAANDLASFAGYPLVARGELVGVVAMFSHQALDATAFEWLGVFAAQAAIALENARLRQRLEAENASLREDAGARTSTGIVGDSPALRRVLEDLERVAKTTSTVLLQGESGTGKELFARALHEQSSRSAGPLVKVNCGALAPTLVESELFGHERGAFTGATSRRVGRFELADGGTLFLDEITELPLDLQAKLLRVVQERELERVGGTRSIPVDVRIVAATNRDLQAEVKAGRFRSDLFFRLNVFPLRIPPLRERREDIALLARAFLERFGKDLEADAVAYLETYDWPGNVRELENVLERAAVLSRRRSVEVSDLPELTVVAPLDRKEGPSEDGESLKARVGAYERALIVEALRQTGGNQSEAARLLQTSRATLQYRMKTLGV